MAYGAPPGTLTGQLSVPHHNPGGRSPSGRACAAPAAPAVVAVVAAAAGAWVSSPVISSSAVQAPGPPRARHGCLISPPAIVVVPYLVTRSAPPWLAADAAPGRPARPRGPRPRPTGPPVRARGRHRDSPLAAAPFPPRRLAAGYDGCLARTSLSWATRRSASSWLRWKTF